MAESPNGRNSEGVQVIRHPRSADQPEQGWLRAVNLQRFSWYSATQSIRMGVERGGRFTAWGQDTSFVAPTQVQSFNPASLDWHVDTARMGQAKPFPRADVSDDWLSGFPQQAWGISADRAFSEEERVSGDLSSLTWLTPYESANSGGGWTGGAYQERISEGVCIRRFVRTDFPEMGWLQTANIPAYNPAPQDWHVDTARTPSSIKPFPLGQVAGGWVGGQPSAWLIPAEYPYKSRRYWTGQPFSQDWLSGFPRPNAWPVSADRAISHEDIVSADLGTLGWLASSTSTDSGGGWTGGSYQARISEGVSIRRFVRTDFPQAGWLCAFLASFSHPAKWTISSDRPVRRPPNARALWGAAWELGWIDAWELPVIGGPTIFYQDQPRGGDDAPKRTRQQHEREKDLSESLEQTMRAMLWHPRTVAAVAASVADTREAIRSRQRHAAATTLLETRARLADEQDDEEWILMS